MRAMAATKHPRMSKNHHNVPYDVVVVVGVVVV
jgi:hypothetical protein